MALSSSLRRPSSPAPSPPSSSPRCNSPSSSPSLSSRGSLIPTLTLNGLPVSAPSSAAYPPAKRFRGYRFETPPSSSSSSSSTKSSPSWTYFRLWGRSGSGNMAATSSSTSSSPSKTLRSRVPPSSSSVLPSKPNPRQQHSGSQSLSEYKPSNFPSKKNHAQYSSNNHMPSPLLEPINWMRWLNWRVNIWLQASFAGGMLTDWESWSVAIVTLMLAIVILYSLFFQFPATVKAVHKRATYYIYGSHAGAGMPGAEAAGISGEGLTGNVIVDGWPER